MLVLLLTNYQKKKKNAPVLEAESHFFCYFLLCTCSVFYEINRNPLPSQIICHNPIN